jgi:hypothetical protein
MPVKIFLNGEEKWIKPTTTLQCSKYFGKLKLRIDVNFYVAEILHRSNTNFHLVYKKPNCQMPFIL